MIQHEFRLRPSGAATVTNVQKTWGAVTASERIVHRLSAKFRSDNMEIDHKPGAGRPKGWDVDYLWQKLEARSKSMVQQLGPVISVSPKHTIQTFGTNGHSEKDRNMP
ncbi:hypothetical protein TNIN_324351 [Trichonephila inaurata madagascariensis]|uniref:Uncharacterized protein n=1 Tax=Trichonephila inaurata madagascariensis TaxID=2747483 RepID=A0A8X6XQ14_9ARAC|nr:hypothetical protein TNIN_324351 [Trichonephila inaurata madagascariensis]